MKQFFTLLILIGILWFGLNYVGKQLRPKTATLLDSNPDLTIDGMPVLEVIRLTGARVVDGDSIRIPTANGQEVDIRLASIDAPESQQAFGQEAAAYLESLTQGRELIGWRTGTDRYERLLTFVFVEQPDGELFEINAQMIRAGYAWHYRQYSSNPVLDSFEREAQTARIGLWNSAEQPVPPWEFRNEQ